MTHPNIQLIPPTSSRPSPGNIYRLKMGLNAKREGSGRDDRFVLIRQGEFVECLRGLSPQTWVMRTADGFHFYMTADDFNDPRMEFIGTVFIPVRVHSLASLDDILKLGLYFKPHQF